MTFDPEKPVQTRNGRKARIICTDLKEYAHGDTVMALIEQDDGSEDWTTYRSSGRYVDGMEDSQDLINIPEKRWVNVNKYRSNLNPRANGLAAGGVYSSRASADENATYEYRIACLEFTEGDGLE